MSAWISTKDRLPEIEEAVLIYLDGYHIVARRHEDGEAWVVTWNGHAMYDEKDETVYWMPLPDPPKE
jgi:hypothetical protein